MDLRNPIVAYQCKVLGGVPEGHDHVIHLPDHVVQVERLAVGVPRHVVALGVGEVPVFSSRRV